MAHELTTRKNGFVEFAYAASEGKGWHGLGQQVADDATLQQWIEASGMDWKVLRSQIRYAVERSGDESQFITLPDQHVLFRSDTKAALGVVSKGYKVVQPAEVLAFFKDVADAEGLQLSAAGTLFDGKRFWATAKIGEASPVSSRDKIGGYLLLSTSADGSLATEARFSSVRVVCNNTLQAARAQGKASVRLTHRSVFNAEQIHEQLGTLSIRDAWATFQQQMTQLADTPVALDRADDLVIRLLVGGARNAVTVTEDRADEIRGSAGYRKVLELFNGGQRGYTLPGVQGTAYGLLQATTEYFDHAVRSTSADNRFASAQWGPGAQMKADAFEMLLALPSSV